MPVTKTPTTAEIAASRERLAGQLEKTRGDLARAQVAAAEAHLVGRPLPDELQRAIAQVQALEAITAGYEPVAAAGEYRELGFAVASAEAKLHALEREIDELDAANLTAVKAEVPRDGLGRLDLDRYHIQVDESRLALVKAIGDRDRAQQALDRAEKRRAELQRLYPGLRDALWIPESTQSKAS
jgi:hypothetical protein